jgi:heme/copper-type cytochrome/quinol oxidase subunit 2
MSRSQRLGFAALAVLVAVVAIIVLASGGGDDEQATTTTQAAEVTPTGSPTQQPEEATPPERRIEVKGGDVVGGVQEIKVKEGDHIRFTVTSDSADEVHVHGYDVKKDVAPGEPVAFDIPAKITGIFEVELEEAGVQIASLRVEP